MSNLLLFAALLACDSTPPPEATAPGPSSMTESLRRAAVAGQTSVQDRDPSEIPDRLARESERAATPAPATVDSEACVAAKSDRDRLKARVDTHYEDNIKPAEDRLYQAENALAGCLGDLSGCGADPDKYKAIAERRSAAERSLSRERDRVGELGAELFPLNQQVNKACGLGRY